MQQLPLAQTGAFPKLFLDYLQKRPELAPFYNQFPDSAGFEKLLTERQFSASHREVLVDALQRQYAQVANPPAVERFMDERTFAVTTGHQLNIFTGPLYIIYKIITTIRLAEELKKAFPAYHFVPVYWMATEDHDFEEIASFSLFGQKHTWATDQRGAVGRMNPAELVTVLEALPEKLPVFEQAYLQNDTLEKAVRQYMHELFGQYGLVCISGDDAALKGLFREVMTDDLWNQTASGQVAATSQKLNEMGYKTQLSAREINFFYLEKGLRERIIREGNAFVVNNTDLRFSEEEMQQLIEHHPEKLSPNVVLRPVYQEVILPNLAYIGGPSEVPYWLQLKGVFDHYGVPYPAVMPRNFALLVTKPTQKKLDKIGVDVADLFQDEVTLRRSFVEKISENSLSVADEWQLIADAFQKILEKGKAIDPTLQGAIEAEKTKTEKSIENLEKRLKKAEERQHETAIAQLMGVREKLFPGGGLQERKDNLMSFALNNPEFIQQLHQAFNPLDFRFYILEA